MSFETPFSAINVKQGFTKEGGPVLQAIGHAVHERRDFIQVAYRLNGGWESWAQVELAVYLAEGFQHGATVVVERETAVIDQTTGKKKWVDFDISTEKAGSDFLVEMKCQSFHNAKNFTSDVLKDLAKVGKYNVGPHGTWKTGCVVGICVVEGDATNLEDLMAHGFTAAKVKDCHIVIFYKQF
ncbi:hypothetical protein TWF694_003094 [Orbilia ellipsospora]|uniref:Uncharacterized protein n=1 Tax=Orbilia ellipsospora TaxID=2528407 RepID=A0AAV9X0I1_9PEZI